MGTCLVATTAAFLLLPRFLPILIPLVEKALSIENVYFEIELVGVSTSDASLWTGILLTTTNLVLLVFGIRLIVSGQQWQPPKWQCRLFTRREIPAVRLTNASRMDVSLTPLWARLPGWARWLHLSADGHSRNSSCREISEIRPIIANVRWSARPASYAEQYPKKGKRILTGR